MANNETIRRLRYGDLLKVMRCRYRRNGYQLTDDDAGREDLRELLLPVSLGQGHERRMTHVIKLWAPWMIAHEAEELIDDVNRTPEYLRKANAKLLGERLNLLNREREAWGIRTIRPVDMTEAQLEKQRKVKDRARKERRRRKAGSKPRAIYLATSKAREKPWQRDGIGRSQWYRRQKRLNAVPASPQTDATGPSAIKLKHKADTLVASEIAERSVRKG